MTTATRQSATRQFWVYVGAAAVLVYSLAPFLWIMIASITPEVSKDYGTLSGRRVTYFPSHPTFDNYVDLFVNNPFALYFRNSTIIETTSGVASATTAIATSRRRRNRWSADTARAAGYPATPVPASANGRATPTLRRIPGVSAISRATQTP